MSSLSASQQKLFRKELTHFTEMVDAEMTSIIRSFGAANRLQQVDYTGATPITTTYSNDVFGLTQVLVADDGTTQVYNLFGLDLISQDSGAEVRTLLVDGLGSVRLEMVGDVVETATTYSPYGEVLEQTGTSGTVYGFTGEQEDGATGLLYLRARYYDSSLKTFMSRDRWEGTGWRPETLHWYLYVGQNPINFTDPTGHDPYNDDDFNPRNLTLWLYREMITNVRDHRLQSVRRLNEAADKSRGLRISAAVAIERVCVINPVVITGAAIAVGGGPELVAGYQFYLLVGDRKPWDFKHRINDYLGQGITLCSTGKCEPDIEFSVPGNIHFGFVSREAGYSGVVTHIGAGAAEIFDPAHRPFTSEYDYDPSGKFRIYRDSDGLGVHINLGDDRFDHQAVQFGIYLYNQYGRDLSFAQFQRELGRFMDLFMTIPPDDWAVRPAIADQWPYPVGFFDPTR